MKAGFGIPIVVAAALMAGCATPPKGNYDPEIKVSAEAAQAAFQRGEIARADALYVRALTRARLTDNRDEIIRNTYNLALCKMASGKLGEAQNLLAQAKTLAPERGEMAARILLAESESARLVGDGTASEQLARRALVAGADREGQVQSWLLQGESWVHEGQLQSALDSFRAASRLVTGETPAMIRARLDDLEVGLVQARLLPGSVGLLQVRRSEWLKQSGQYKDMIKALQSAATAFESESKWAEAFDCRIRAAQSLLASGDSKLALLEARKADELAGQTGNINHKTLAGSLLNELK